MLGPFGLGPLTLGATPAQARATNVLRDFDDPGPDPGQPGGCVYVQPEAAANSEQGAVVFSKDLGLVAIPELMVRPSGMGWFRFPATPAAVYRIDVADDGKVRGLTLQLSNQNCYE